ncbi:protein of unknown function [Filimonas lacunae]|uniref:DUF4783 domain-containing protein n=1 Tax=Filimonas lacunae TaxID=477680 RepID=A0A173MRW9_9BACT|nr:DUF4783 domain-containing protein [Filimonas lacunae]BAV10131.1 hypothetical protein FLA_6191 [Filimonas lacunae]SIT18995.1 protein of unknown function [Filimonas lacunae]
MKKILLLAGVVLSLLSFRVSGDADSIINALKDGNAEQLSQYFDNILDVKLPEKDEIKNVGKNQAGITLKSFFADNKVKGFELSSQREMGGTMYITGKLQAAAKSYNITLMMKSKADKMAIITVRIN